MTTAEYTWSSSFAGFLKEDFVLQCKPAYLEMSPIIEGIKGKAALLSLSIFDFGKTNLCIEGKTFESLFSQQRYGGGFTKAVSEIWAYHICLDDLDEETLRSPDVADFSKKVNELSTQTFERLSSGNQKLADVRGKVEKLDNYGGYYDRVYLSNESVKEIAPAGRLDVAVAVDPKSGQLIAKIPEDLSAQLLNAYRLEIEEHLTEQGKKNLQLPDNIGFVVVAYKDELDKLSPEAKKLLDKDRTIDLAFDQPYVVPVRGDNRYTLISSILIESDGIKEIRTELGLPELYSEGRPLRFTFGAVRNPLLFSNEQLTEKLSKSGSLKNWMNYARENAKIETIAST